MFDFYELPENEFGEWDEDKSSEYCAALWQAFSESPEAAEANEQFGGIGWTPIFLEYGFGYVGSSPSRMSPADVNEIVFQIFPRKVSTQPDSAAEIIGELRAFFQFLLREYSSPSAEPILEILTDEAVSELEQELGDSTNFGMAKSFVLMGRGAGFDMSSQEGLNELMQMYNSSLSQQQDDVAASQPESSPSLFGHTSHPLGAKQRKKRDQQRRKKLANRKRR